MHIVRFILVSLVLVGWAIPFSVAAYFRFRLANFMPKNDFDNWAAIGFELYIVIWLAIGVVWLLCSVIAFIGGLRWNPRRDRGKCRKCGYDLRGLPEARCPECGAKFDKNVLQEIHDSRNQECEFWASEMEGKREWRHLGPLQ
jgi:hypothetical protein